MPSQGTPTHPGAAVPRRSGCCHSVVKERRATWMVRETRMRAEEAGSGGGSLRDVRGGTSRRMLVTPPPFPRGKQPRASGPSPRCRSARRDSRLPPTTPSRGRAARVAAAPPPTYRPRDDDARGPAAEVGREGRRPSFARRRPRAGAPLTGPRQRAPRRPRGRCGGASRRSRCASTCRRRTRASGG